MAYGDYLGPDAISSYGCCRCQSHHYEGDALYEPHIGFQSKHGTKKVPRRYALVGKLPVQFAKGGRFEIDTTGFVETDPDASASS
jgi:hypothetical protein